MMQLETRDLSYRVADKSLLEAVHLTLSSGLSLGIVGPNGAGKSTLLRLLSGFWKPSAGQVCLQSQPLETLSMKQRSQWLAVVSPREDLPPFPMSVEAYLKLGRAPFQNWLGSWTETDQMALEQAIEACELGPMLAASLNSLSSGEWQRVQLGRALAQTPELLLLDEPTSHLDVSAQLRIMHLLREWVQQGKMVVAVVHDLNLAAQYLDRILLLHRGRAVALGTPAEVLTAEHLAQVYQLNWEIRLHPDSGRPLLLPEYGI